MMMRKQFHTIITSPWRRGFYHQNILVTNVSKIRVSCAFSTELCQGNKFFSSIVSREIIKPSTPTPSNLNTYNLSELDIIAGKAYQPLILLYPNNLNCSLTAQDKARVLKKSLSQTLTRFYTFAGRLPANETPVIDCNDEGVLFVEAKIDSQLDASQLISGRDEDLDGFFANDMAAYNSPHNNNNNMSLFGVQLNYFVCGGVALAVSMSHLLGDASTLLLFMNHWASVALHGSADHEEALPLNATFIHPPRTQSIINQEHNNHVMRTFVFPNSKLSDLKNKVVAVGSINNPTRVEVLTSLLYKTALAAATTNSGCFKPSYLLIMVDIRNKLAEKPPQTTVGNFVSVMIVPTRNKSETSLSLLVGEIKKHKLQVLEGVQSVKHAAENLISSMSKLGNEVLYGCTCSCGFPFNKVDFGWGKPMATAFAFRSAGKNGFVLMDTPGDDGIQAQVILEKQDMEVFENDKEMLSFCQMNNL